MDTPDTRWTEMPKGMPRNKAQFAAWLEVYRMMKPPPFDPAAPLTGLALRLLAVSNAFHECGSSRIS